MPRLPKAKSAAKDSTATYGMAGFVLANGRMSSNQSGEDDSGRGLIEAELMDTALRDSAFPQSEAIAQVLSAVRNNMVALPGQLFYSTQIPVCLWFLAKNKNADAYRGFRDRRLVATSVLRKSNTTRTARKRCRASSLSRPPPRNWSGQTSTQLDFDECAQ